jgi:hypothetical protein
LLPRLQICLALTLSALAALAPSAGAIVNGTTAGDSSWPWAVQVFPAESGSVVGQCGGTLVAPTRVVTTGSCASLGTEVFVLANTKELADEAGGSLSQATDVRLAPGWEAATATDVALLTISPAPDPATPIELLGEDESGDFPTSASALIAGWGATSSSGDASNLLRQGQVTLTSCDATPMRCSTTTTEPCFGDSGGPAIVQLGTDTVSADPSPSNGTWRLVAMPVGGDGDCTLGLYADLTTPTMRAFIEGTTIVVDPPGTSPQPSAGPAPTPTPISVSPPQTRLLKAQIDAAKGSATFKFKGSANTRSFQCALASNRRKKPKFKACRSPKRYRNLAAGTYTFKVRAVSLGGIDATPARKRFTIR